MTGNYHAVSNFDSAAVVLEIEPDIWSELKMVTKEAAPLEHSSWLGSVLQPTGGQADEWLPKMDWMFIKWENEKMEIFKLVQDTNVFFFVMYLASGSSHVQLGLLHLEEHQAHLYDLFLFFYTCFQEWLWVWGLLSVSVGQPGGVWLSFLHTCCEVPGFAV